MHDGPDPGMGRRVFLRRAGTAGGGLLGASLLGRPAAWGSACRKPPNLLAVLVDQMRQPQHLAPGVSLHQLVPGLARLRAQSVAFTGHVTASDMCSPARAAMLTGLYSHQTAAFLRLPLNGGGGQPGLNPGYSTWWWGKFHVTDATTRDLTPWGFSGGTCPSPNGTPGQGLRALPSALAPVQQQAMSDYFAWEANQDA